jgi:hypothetical protein
LGQKELAMTTTNTRIDARFSRITLLTIGAAAIAVAMLLVTTPAAAQDDVPHYCATSAGVLGPYPNDGSVHVGDPCFGTKNGRKYYGTAVMSADSSGGEEHRSGRNADSVPHYCSTDAGVLGPYPNDGSVRVGDPCFGTKNGRKYYGTAVMGPDEK